jgi:hypothetical protein
MNSAILYIRSLHKGADFDGSIWSLVGKSCKTSRYLVGLNRDVFYTRCLMRDEIIRPRGQNKLVVLNPKQDLVVSTPRGFKPGPKLAAGL